MPHRTRREVSRILNDGELPHPLRVKTALQLMGIRQAKVAKKLGIRPQHLSAILNSYPILMEVEQFIVSEIEQDEEVENRLNQVRRQRSTQ